MTTQATAGVHWAVTSDGAKVYAADMAAANKLSKALDRVAGELKKTGKAGKAQAKVHQDAAAKVRGHVRQQELIAKVMRQTGASSTAARRAVAAFGKDLDKADKEAVGLARSIDKAEREIRELAHAQRLAAGTSLTSHMRTQAAVATRLSASMNNLRVAYGAVAGAAGAGVAVRVALDLVSAYQEQIRAETQIEARLRSTGNTAGHTIEGLKRYASELQNLTGVGDELILTQAGVLLSFRGIARENFGGALEAALDMSKALGTDLKSAVLQVGKALDSGAAGLTALQRSGTRFTDDQKKMIKALFATGKAAEAQAIIIKELGVQYGGTAEKLRETAGFTDALAGELGDLKEVVGGLISEELGFRSYVEVLTLAARETKGLGGDSETTARQTGPLASALHSLGLAAAVYAKAVNKLRGENRDAGESFNTLTSATFAALNSLGTGAQNVAQAIRPVAAVLRDVAAAEREQKIERLVTSWQNLLGALAPSNEALRQAAIHLLDTKAPAQEAGEAVDTLAEKLRKLIESMQNEFVFRMRILADTSALENLPGAFQHQTPTIATQPLESVEQAWVQDLEVHRERTAEENQYLVERLGDTFNSLGDMFESFGGGLGDSIGRIFNIVGRLAGLIAGAFGSGGSQSAGDALDNFGAVGDWLKVFTGLYDLAEALVEGSRARRFGSAVVAGITDGRTHGQSAAGKFEVLNTDTANRLFESMLRSFEAFALQMGRTFEFLPEIAVRIRNDGKQVEASVGGVIIGVFADMQTALEEALQFAFSTSVIEGLGPNMQRALDRVMASLTLEQFVALIPRLQNLDDMAQGISLGVSNATHELRKMLTSMDLWSRQLLQTGASLADVIALREAMLAQLKREVEVRGLGLAGITSGLDALQEWLDEFDATNQAFRDESDRQEELGRHTREAADAINRLTGGNSEAAGQIVALFGALDDGGPAMEDTALAARLMEEALRDAVAAVVGMSEELGVLNRILDFQERYGALSEDNEEIRLRIAELEFRIAQIQIVLAVKQLDLLLEMGLITEAQLDQFRAWAKEVAGWEFPGLPTPDAPRRGGGGNRRESRLRAAASFEDAARSIALSLAGVSDEAQQFADDIDALRDQAREGRVPVEELAQALSDFTALWLRDLSAPWVEISRAAGETDAQTAFRQAGEQAAQALADAAAAEAENPAAFAEARRAIRHGLAATLREVGAGLIEDFGGPLTGLRREGAAAVESIQFMVENMRELGLTAGRIAATIRQEVVPQLLDMAIQEAERVGDLERAAELRARQEALQIQLQIVQIAIWEQMLEAAGAMDDSLRDIIAGIRRDMRRSTAEIPDETFERPLRDALEGVRELARRTVSDIQALASAAGVELPIEMAQQWAAIQFELARAELMVALATPEVTAAFERMKLDITEWTDFVAGLEISVPQAVQGLGNAVLEAMGLVPSAGGRGTPADTGADELARLREELAALAREADLADMSEFDAARARINDFWDDFAERARALGLEQSAIDQAESLRLRALADLQEQYYSQATQGIRDLLDELDEGSLSGRPEQDLLEEKLADLREQAARAAAGDLEALESFDEEARRGLELVGSVFGAGVPGGAIEAEIRALLSGLAGVTGPGGVPAPLLSQDGVSGALVSQLKASNQELRSDNENLVKVLGRIHESGQRSEEIRHAETVDIIAGLAIGPEGTRRVGEGA